MSDPERDEVARDAGEVPPGVGTRPARIVVAVGGALALVAAAAVLLFRQFGDTSCDDWHRQFDSFSEGLAMYVRAKGQGQLTALAHLEGLELRCAKVTEARDLCVQVYRNLHLAEVEHGRARQALGELERAIGALDEPTREVAERRFIESEATFTIADKLGLSQDEVRRHLEAAREQIGGQKLDGIHGRFEAAVTRSKQLVEDARTGNEACDTVYKRLLAEEQSR